MRASLGAAIMKTYFRLKRYTSPSFPAAQAGLQPALPASRALKIFRADQFTLKEPAVSGSLAWLTDRGLEISLALPQCGDLDFVYRCSEVGR